jgi:hypothetical protein
MKKTFGERRMSRPDGMLRPVYWPQLALMDTWTGDGRLLLGEGGDVRELPRPFYAQFDNDGHYGATLVGSIDEVSFNDDKTMSGWGWVLDDENGRNLVRYNKAGALRTNSVDLAEVKVQTEIEWGSDDPSSPDYWDYEIKFTFTEWSLGATTAVGMPAFRDARFELPDDEMTAALAVTDEPLTITARPTIFVQAPEQHLEMAASVGDVVPWDDFNIPESPAPHKIVVDEKGRVFGHLAQWGKAHRGHLGLVIPPYPKNNYTEFNHPGPLTEKGQVGTGPIFFLGGHPKTIRGMSPEQIAEAYGGVENAWGDVRVTAGRFGPWISGRVRPGISDERLYAARASHISGHWLGDDLCAIVSVNVPGFMPGAGFAHQFADGTMELVAGFMPDIPEPRLDMTLIEPADGGAFEIAVTDDADERERTLALEVALDDE